MKKYLLMIFVMITATGCLTVTPATDEEIVENRRLNELGLDTPEAPVNLVLFKW